uniref:Ig-like domain-containing protein n=1 Tax=Periophthalmus magnuspinnatus TaxID=409849 RepID=A0A3B4ARN1_9GOBI
MIQLFNFLFMYYIFVGSSLNDKVHQTPKDIYNTKGTSAKIQCSHEINNYDRILWYKQLKDGQLQFLGYIVGSSAFPEDGAKIKIEGDANKDKPSILTIEEPSSAMYYCAASLTVEKTNSCNFQIAWLCYPQILCFYLAHPGKIVFFSIHILKLYGSRSCLLFFLALLQIY